jgi:hypothetical protein
MVVTLGDFEVAKVRLSYARMTGHLSDADLIERLAEAKRELIQLRDRGMLMIGVYDLRETPGFTAKQRYIQADWLRSIKPIERQVVIGYAFVTPSVVMRGVITAVNWLAPHGIPQKVHSELDEAVAWAFDICENNGVDVSDTTRRDGYAHFHALLEHKKSRHAMT